ncbi:hypothetical protein N5P37_012020 [Trichoderma harzianum]|uniref:Uncharacterized protein n=1 Tax=Trichoderma harzianum CBS 226.95 TaxID=983964 RepID=A0A2T3ZYQ8_TRIHA|nr:hypothetical protein M431DRAFT_534624 [Trichoderma harzianum CBS 226.95]KAK0755198.1 hypothetical protein N5P37_012020 [Trichoderma harzianum]PKK51425.1 hypothetical protein CI102_3426 [Trichoderma harzianum]PTB49940.1 hypothetical protein M431DRAFT_534624 [Trichoderma harzianum CBS 226.95]
MYSFIQIHGKEDVKPVDRERRQLIRQVAMIKAGRARKIKTARNRPLPRNPIVSLPINPMLLETQQPQLLYKELGSGRRDPFTAYPVQMSLRMHEIIEQLYVDPKKHFCGFRYFWLPIAMGDPAAFHQLLCNVSLAAAKFTGSPERNKEESVIHHNAAINNVLSRLRVTGKEQAASLVLPILALAQHANMYRDAAKFEVHFTALEKVVQIGGGLENMTLEPYTRLLLLFVEVNSRARNDSLPLFPLPVDLLGSFQISSANIEDTVYRDLILISPFRSLFPDGMDSFAQTLCDTKSLGEKLNSQIFSSSIITQSLRDATRISALLGLAAVRRRFLAFQVFIDIHLAKLKDLLNFLFPMVLCHEESNGIILFWQFFMGGMEAADPEDWSWFATGISMLATQLEVESWAAAMTILRSIFWIDSVHSSRGRALWDASQSIMTLL